MPISLPRANTSRVIEVIDRPLGFYVLALLIVETFIGIVVGLGRESEGTLRLGLWLGVGMFVYITLSVSVLVWSKAHLLTFDRDAHLKDRRRQAPYGTERRQVKDRERLPPPVEAKASQ